MRVYMPRFHSSDSKSNIARLQADCAEAARLECALAVFPEIFMSGYKLHVEPQLLRRLFAEQSQAYPDTLFFFGSISEEGFNRMPAYLGGKSVAEYDKVQLFMPNGEAELWQSGSRYVGLAHGDWRIGMLLCNDIRFAEHALSLRRQLAVNMLVVPALWPWQRDHVWSALLRARAIEHNCFVLGCCISSVDNGLELFDGAGNHAFDPLGNEIYPQGRVYELDQAVFEQVVVDTKQQAMTISAASMSGEHKAAG